jgi:hypothetical protein
MAGLVPQVGFTRLAALNIAQLGQARVAVPSTSSLEAQKTWMPAAISAFTRVFDALCAGMTVFDGDVLSLDVTKVA